MGLRKSKPTLPTPAAASGRCTEHAGGGGGRVFLDGDTMPCLVSGNLTICGGFKRRSCHFFTKDRHAVLFCDSLWYEPAVIVKAKRGESDRHFEARARKELKFKPKTYRGWWRTVAVPQLKKI